MPLKTRLNGYFYTLIGPKRTRPEIGYGLFLSYSGQRDRGILPSLQRAIEKQPRPWYKPPLLRVFLDKSSIPIGPHLWSKIESGLSRSNWLVVIASPEAAESKWVDREIAWWLTNRSSDTLLLVLSSGDLVWDDDHEDWNHSVSTALPPRLLGAFEHQPVWKAIKWHKSSNRSIDPDIDGAALSILSVIRGISEDDLHSESLRETQRNLRWAQLTGLVLTILVILATIVARVAVVQKDRADKQAMIAAARLVTTIADNKMDTDVRSALLLAVAAYKIDPSDTNLSTLLRANIASPSIVRYLTTSSPVTALETSADGSTVAAGTADGQVLLWSPSNPELTRVFKLTSSIASLAIDRSGETVLATDGTQVALWQKASGTHPIKIEGENSPDLVAISPSGKLAAIHSIAQNTRLISNAFVGVLDLQSGEIDESHPDNWNATTMSFISDSELALFTGQRDTRIISLTHNWEFAEFRHGGCGASHPVGDPSVNGRYVACGPLKGEPILIFPSDGSDANSFLNAYIPQASTAIPATLSLSGHTVAVPGQDGALYVAGTSSVKDNTPPATRLTGATVTSEKLLRFMGDSENRLVSAHQDQITFWDMQQTDRITRTLTIPSVMGCNACQPNIFVSPNSQAAIVSTSVNYNDSDADATLLQNLAPDNSPPSTIIAPFRGIPIWLDEKGKSSLIIVGESYPWGSGTEWEEDLSIPKNVTLSPPVRSAERIVAASSAPGSKVIIKVDSEGNIALEDTNGRDLKSIPSPVASTDVNGSISHAAISHDGSLVAIAKRDDTDSKDKVTIFDLHSLRTVGTVDGQDLTDIVYSDSELVIERREAIEYWSLDGHSLHRTNRGENPAGLPWIIAMDQKGSMVAEDTTNEYTTLIKDGLTLAIIPPTRVDWYAHTGIALSADGKMFLRTTTGSDGGPDGILEVRDISADALIRSACHSSGSDLSSEEWRTIVGIARPKNAYCI
ncbi:toll/interleukin-1 receptor domain-containing protein [Nocardia sp. NPDC006630]|uniref:toll/interleukin-1 receptor domain-containing protein n=1 Tax=Nocardia sp. NPDC006630 TaxID=3157181 RepID=UPI0033ACCD2D